MDTPARPLRFSYKYANRFMRLAGAAVPGRRKLLFRSLTFGAFLAVWQLAAVHTASELLLPEPLKVAEALAAAVIDPAVLYNLALTLRRVLLGLGIALALGMGLGLAMGASEAVLQLVDPVINPLRQVPIMAWVPLTIVWFGLGDGPTLFLIAMVGVFPILLSTVSGVQGLDRSYVNAARSMGAGRLTVFGRVIVPGALPEVLTGMRVAVSAGWMSVI
jgi:ABC-type nitrate/sulfonate/bicarbonate transport system permease component